MSKSKFILPLKLQLFADEVIESNVSEEVVTPQETTETSEVVEQTEEVASPQKVDKPVQSQEDNAKFAAARREAEARARQETEAKARLEAENQRILQVLNKVGYSGSALEIADHIEAQLSQRPIEEVRAEREAQEQQQLKELQTQQELEHYRNLAMQSMVKEGIDKINKAYPEAKIKDLNDLGEPFVRLISAGLDEVEAYEVMQARKQKTEVSKPPITGAVNGQVTQDKDFFTKEEVEKMSEAEVSKNYEKIMKSTAKW